MSFAPTLLAWFARHGRSGLPWRTNRDPYRIVVSEFMLQQTQVDRVVPLFEAFVASWPSFEALAGATQADVLRAWRGLGYNSRAIRLHRLAKAVVTEYGGMLPRDEASLRALPGVGAYTARAVAAFAFDADVVAHDTNIRRILHRTQYGLEWPPLATAAELDAMAAALVPHGQGFAFNSALMDLGASVCSARAPKCLICPLQRLCRAAPVDPASLARLSAEHASPRSPQERLRFEQTSRFVRGRVIDRLRALPPGERISLLDLHRELAPTLPHHDAGAIDGILTTLARDGIIDHDPAGLRLTL